MNKRQKFITILTVLCMLIMGISLISFNTGFVTISPIEVFKTVLGYGTEQQRLILFDLRLPRIILAVLVGIGLAISGVILQSITRNELAEPGILGINAGAGLFVVLFITFFPSISNSSFLGAMSLPFAALFGGLLTALLIYSLAFKRNQGTNPVRLILIGVAVTAGMNAAMIILTIALNPFQYQFAKLWLVGSLWGSDWGSILSIVPWFIILLPFVFYRARFLDVMDFGDKMSTGLGISVERERILFMTISVLLASVCVSVGGGISFVGLIAPHLSRRLVGPRHKFLIPITGLTGGLLVLTADTIGRSILQPSEIPTGIVIAIIGAPYFLHLLAKSKT